MMGLWRAKACTLPEAAPPASHLSTPRGSRQYLRGTYMGQFLDLELRA